MADSQRKTANLWGETSTTNRYIDNQGNTGTNPNGDVYSLKTFTVSPSTTYTFSWSGFTVGNDNNLPYIRICFYTSNGGTFISRTLVNPNNYLNKYVSFTIPNNCTYVDIRIDSEASTRGQHFDNIMLNTGSTAKPYEPYGWQHSLRKYDTDTDTFTTLPVDIYADGNNATVGLKGNTVQNGTPTPSNPVEVNGVGVRTANLLDMSTVSVGYHLDITTGLPVGFGSSRMATLTAIDVSQFSEVTLAYTSVGDAIQFMYSIFDGTDTLIERVAEKASGDSIDVSSAKKLYICFYRNTALTKNSVEEAMLNTGSTAKPYEPYGYFIEIEVS